MSATEIPETVNQAALLRDNPTIVCALPAPDVEFTLYACPVACRPAIKSIQRRSLIERIDEYDNGGGGTYGIYRTRPAVHAWITEHYADRTRLPCGHGGFSNEGDGQYGCAFGACTATFDRETVERALAGEELEPLDAETVEAPVPGRGSAQDRRQCEACELWHVTSSCPRCGAADPTADAEGVSADA